MDIDLRVLKLMESEKGIPFDELVEIIEAAILTAYQKHMIQAEPRVAPVKNPKSATGLGCGAGSADTDTPRAPRVAPELPEARVELDRKSGIVTIYVPEKDDEGVLIGEAVATPDDFGRIAAFAAKQVINQRLRDIADEAVIGEFKGR